MVGYSMERHVSLIIKEVVAGTYIEGGQWWRGTILFFFLTIVKNRVVVFLGVGEEAI